jgi:antitoxin component of MazEF toxin-antitoxin module
MEKSNTIFRGAIARFGNSQGIRLPQDILKQANLYENFAEVPGGKIIVDLIVTPDSITIKRAPEEKAIWSQEKQNNACLTFLNRVKSPENDEPLPDNFDELYRYSGNPLDKNLFAGLED